MGIPKDLSFGIVVTKDGIFNYNWDSLQIIEPEEYLADWLSKPIYFADDLTFEDFFNHIMNDHERISEIFSNQLGGYALSE